MSKAKAKRVKQPTPLTPAADFAVAGTQTFRHPSRALQVIDSSWYGIVTVNNIDAVADRLNRMFGGYRCSETEVNSVQRPNPQVRLRPNASFEPRDLASPAFQVTEHETDGENPRQFKSLSWHLGGWFHTITAYGGLSPEDVNRHPHGRTGSEHRGNTYLVFEGDETVRLEYTSGSRDEHVCVIGRCGPDPRYAIQPEWLTEQVVRLNDAIVKNDQWDGLSLLADALEDDGCSLPLLLARLRNGTATWAPFMIDQVHRNGKY